MNEWLYFAAGILVGAIAMNAIWLDQARRIRRDSWREWVKSLGDCTITLRSARR